VTTPAPDSPAPPAAGTSPERRGFLSRRWWIAAIAIVALVVAVEVGLNVFQPPRAYVEIINKGANPVQDLRMLCDGRETAVGTVAPGERVGVYVVAHRPSALIAKFKQAGNPITQVEVGDLDAAAMRRMSQKQVVALQEAGVERYMEDNPTWTERAWQKFKDWLSDMFL
jgi:hypothetical protein